MLVPSGAALEVEEWEVPLVHRHRMRVDAQCESGVGVAELLGDPADRSLLDGILQESGLLFALGGIRAEAARQPARVLGLDAGFEDNGQLGTNAAQIFETI